jgi:hypothetical protein
MSKADALLKRAVFYEKLALYSDRKAFLQAIAQQSYLTQKFGPQIKSQLNSVIGDMGAMRVDPSLINQISDMSDSSTPFNRYTLIAALSQAAAKYPKTREAAPQLQNIQNLIAALKDPQEAPPLSQEEAMGTGTGTRVTEEKSKYPYFPSKTQDQLNQILIPYGKIGVPLKLDNSLGPLTQGALKAFEQTYGKPGTPENINEVYWKVVHPGFEAKTPSFK